MGEMWNTFLQIFGKKKDNGYIQLLSAREADNWEVYPRPQLVREDWRSLNGTWKIKDKTIHVPFPPQSELSGYGAEDPRDVPEELLYERTFTVPKEWQGKGKRILLQFGAVDQIAQIFVNGKPAASHEGGYLPFTVDVTDLLHPAGEENDLSVFVQDHLDHLYPWGKQRKDRGGMWYTPVSGIWQSVWMEVVPEVHIRSLKFTAQNRSILVETQLEGTIPEGGAVHLAVELDNGSMIRKYSADGTFLLNMEEASRSHGTTVRPWSPEDPYLYHCTVIAGKDKVRSYFALRTVSIEDRNGLKRICLNGKPVFLKGVLDQGYFCDGLFLPSAAEGYTDDIRSMQALGFNLLRKHIKVEPELFYYDCDRLGMLVMQDMVNSGPYHFLPDTGLPTVGFKAIPERGRKSLTAAGRQRKEFFLEHSKNIQAFLYNHPCVISYTVFNEGWGQFDSKHVGDELRKADPSRIYDYTSGWFERGGSQVESIHEYFHIHPYAQKEKPLLLSECGGYTLYDPDHSYCVKDSYGYGKCEDTEALTDRIEAMYEGMIYPSLPLGLCGLIYTQVSDIEDEVNGFYTYDRKVCKVNGRRMAEMNRKLDRIFEEVTTQSAGDLPE